LAQALLKPDTAMPRRLPPLTHVRAFEAAARHESFKAAAAELHVTEAAVSQHVKQLEGWLDVALFRRTPRGVRLTDAGAAYRPDLTDALDRIADATARVTGGTMTGVLTVSVAPSLGTRWLIPRLHRFTDRHPEIAVRPRVSPTLTDLNAEGVDLAIRHGTGDWPGVRAEHLKDEHLVPVCAPNYAADGDAADPDGLAAMPVLAAEPRSGEWPHWLRAVGAGRDQPAHAVTYATLALALDAAIAGAGVALADRDLVAADVAAGRLCIPVDHACAGPKAYYVVYPDSARVDPRVAVFRDWLMAEAAVGADA
jgi:DNA-binding transcriptional LysR family regulator